MIEWNENLYVGEKIRRRKNRIIKRLNKNKPCLSVFLITEPTNAENFLDIIDSKMFVFKYYKDRINKVHGLAGSKEEAEQLLVKMLEDGKWKF